MAWLKAWAQLKALGFKESVVASCQFGSPHRKEFLLLTYMLDAESLQVKCPGGHDHVKIQGSFTKQSAVYTFDLAKHFAWHFYKALRALDLQEEEFRAGGHESALTNDVLSSGAWRTERVWSWREKSHINVLEAKSACEIVKKAAVDYTSCRVVALLDSRVAKGALAKGRSTAVGLQKVCRRSAALQIAADLHMGWLFAPTRLNCADDPTRDVTLRRSSYFSILDFMNQRELQALHSQTWSRPWANWIRLAVLLTCVCSAGAAKEPEASGLSEVFHFPKSLIFGNGLAVAVLVALCLIWILAVGQVTDFGLWIFSCLDLDFGQLDLANTVSISAIAPTDCFGFSFGLSSKLVTLPSPVLDFGVLSGLLSRDVPRVAWIWVVVSGAFAMEASSAADLRRSACRSAGGLQPTRVARKETLEARTRLLDGFGKWLYDTHGVLLSVLLTAKPADPEEITYWLVQYGQQMYLAGRAYGKYAETVNAIAMMRPSIKKQLTGAWDLAFAWLADEPCQHHPALPLSILLALCSLALLWGWPVEASLLAMTWCGIMRIGETLLTTRGDLILPGDSAPGTNFVLVRIRMPKTRGRAARHQAARIDPPDVVTLLTATFASLPEDEKLWKLSAATLRRRFESLLRGVGLPTHSIDGKRPFSLGSLRPGGATFLLLHTEDAELVRHRGRWVTSKVCEIYLQEVLYTTYTEKLQGGVRQTIQTLSAAFPRILQTAVQYLQSGLPTTVWYQCFQAQDNEELGAAGGDDAKYSAAQAKTQATAAENSFRKR